MIGAHLSGRKRPLAEHRFGDPVAKCGEFAPRYCGRGIFVPRGSIGIPVFSWNRPTGWTLLFPEGTRGRHPARRPFPSEFRGFASWTKTLSSAPRSRRRAASNGPPAIWPAIPTPRSAAPRTNWAAPRRAFGEAKDDVREVIADMPLRPFLAGAALGLVIGLFLNRR